MATIVKKLHLYLMGILFNKPEFTYAHIWLVQ